MKCVVRRLLSVSVTLVFATISLNAQNLMNHIYQTPNLFDGNRGDFNEDGTPDVIFATSEGVEVGLSNSQGGLSFLTSATLSQGDGGALVVSKFTSSGHLDVALIRGNAGTVPNSIDLLLGNGGGTFQIGQSAQLPTGVVPGAITATDFNGDGKVDLAVLAVNKIYILPGDGDGGFGAAKVITTTFSDGSTSSGDPYTPFNLRVGDFDGDGRPDLILSDPIHTAVMFNKGNFSFQQKDVVNEDLQAGPLISDFVSADVNQDGFTDFIITLQGDCPPNTSPCQGGYAVYLSQGSPRTFKVSYTLTPTSQLFTPMHPIVADVNGDGINDVVLMTPQIVTALRVALGKPDGTFNFPQTFVLAQGVGGGVVVAADLNRDGRPDFVNPGGGLITSLNAFPRSPCTASTMSPSVTVCQPRADTYSNSPLHVVAKGTDTAHSITAMQIYVDGQLKSTIKGSSLDTTVALPTGDHLLSVKAWDASGNNFRSVRHVTIYSGTPGQVCSTASDMIHLCAPAQNANLPSPVRVFAASGSTQQTSAMQVYIDHHLAFDDETGNNFIDHTFTLAPGTHSLTAKSWATSGQQLSHSATIHVTQ